MSAGEVTMWARLVPVLAILSTPASAQDYIPQLSTTTGQEIGRAFRTDGKVPTKDGARNDRHDCVPNQMSEQEAKRLALLAQGQGRRRSGLAPGGVALHGQEGMADRIDGGHDLLTTPHRAANAAGDVTSQRPVACR